MTDEKIIDPQEPKNNIPPGLFSAMLMVGAWVAAIVFKDSVLSLASFILYIAAIVKAIMAYRDASLPKNQRTIALIVLIVAAIMLLLALVIFVFGALTLVQDIRSLDGN